MTDRLHTHSLHHTFDVDLATELKSIDLAVMVHHFQFWIRHNSAMKRNFHEGRTWTYQTLKEIAATFPYWTENKVRTIIDKLVDAKILIKGNFNVNAYDRTVWYAFQDEIKFGISPGENEPSLDICENPQMDLGKTTNGFGRIHTTIPDTIPYKEKKKKKSASLPSIEFDYEKKSFINIQQADLDEWTAIYPSLDIPMQLRKMRQWLIDPNNPERDGNRTFIINWLNRAQKESSKIPKKTTKDTTADNPPSREEECQDLIPYNPHIAQSYRNQSEEAYVAYLKRITDKKHYQEYLKSKELE